MSNNPNEEYKQQPIYHQPLYPSSAPTNNNPHQFVPELQTPSQSSYHHHLYNKQGAQPQYLQAQQYGLTTVAPKSTSSDDTHYYSSSTPSMTPNSSIHHHQLHHHHQNIIDSNSQHSGQTQNTLTLLPSIKYYQYSNFSNNSNSTQISNQSNNTSISNGYSDISSHHHHHHQSPYNAHSHHHHLSHSPQPPTIKQQQHSLQSQPPSSIPSITPQSHSQSTDIQSMNAMPIQYHAYDAPISYHEYYQQQPSTASTNTYCQIPPQSLMRSSTPNINLLDLDAEIDDNQGVNVNDDDEKKSVHSNHSRHSRQSGHSQHSHRSHRSHHSHHSSLNKITISKHERKTTKQLELKSFNDDIRAYNTWIGCLHSDDSSSPNASIFFYILYPKLCEYFMEVVNSTRYPTPNDLRPIFIRNGAIAHKYQNDHNNTYLSINKAHFITFWKWFKECCAIIKELRYLWDPIISNGKLNKSHSMNNMHHHRHKNDNGGLGLNFFCQRAVCEANLLQSLDGTFGLRLSSSICGGVVLSYVENNYTDINNKRECKHVILIRQKSGMYLCNKKILSLHDIIRNFVKLKFLYTPNRPIPKEKIF